MSRFWADTSGVAAARRGQIVQRILVEGWSAAQAAAAFGVEERQVARWVVAYRRFGMASLRGEDAAERGPHRWARRLRIIVARPFLALRAGLWPAEPAPCVVLRRSGDDASGRR